MKMNVLSWNIWQGNHLNNIIEFLKQHNLDIIALQEVIEKDNSNSAQIIAEKLNCEYTYYRAVNKNAFGVPQGNAILSRYPIKKSSSHFLSDVSKYKGTAETEPRIAIKAIIDIKGKFLNLFNVHLAYSHMFRNSKFRDLQMTNLIKLLPKEKTVLMGDFNSHPNSSYMEKLTNIMKNADSKMTEPTWTIYPFDYEGFKETELKHRLDYIFISHDLKGIDFQVPYSNGSDHLPVQTIVEIS